MVVELVFEHTFVVFGYPKHEFEGVLGVVQLARQTLNTNTQNEHPQCVLTW